MADQKISDLADSGAPQDTDQLVIARAGSNFSLLISALKAAIPGGVSSVFGRTGTVTAQSGDYTAAQVGAVASVAAGDTSIVVGGTGTNPTLETGTLDVIATDHAPAANWSNNSKKITSLANGAGAQDAAAFGQIPTALPPNGTAGGGLSGTYPNPKVAKITETSGPTDLTIGTITDGQFLKRSGTTLISAAGGTGTVTSVTAADGSIVIAGTGTDPTVKTGTLDAIASAHAPVANWSNNSHKITSVLDPTAAQDAATKNYVDTNVPGNAGGKGHLTTATAVNAPADLSPGSDGTILTANSGASTGLSWSAAPGLVKLFDSTIAGTANTIDTGANALAAGHGDLLILLMARCDDVGATLVSVGLRFNGDGGAHYDEGVARNHIGTVGAASNFADSSIIAGSMPGASATASYAGSLSYMVPSYDQTTFFKTVTGTAATTGSANAQLDTWVNAGSWRSTAAINQVTVVDRAGGNFIIGSRMVIYGLQ